MKLLLDFFNTVANLKTIPRQGWIDKLELENPESVSDHTYSMTMMALIFSEIKKLDTLRVLKMSLIHDLAESHTGDLTPTEISKDEKINLEKNTMEKTLKDIPEEQRCQLSEIWREFLEQKTPESILVHELDKLEMALQAIIYKKNGNQTVQSFLQSAEKEIKIPELKELFRKIINQ